jgi:DNA-binding transcriptional ArsR family regulator
MIRINFNVKNWDVIIMTQYTIVAPMGESVDTIYQVIRTFPTNKVVLITDQQQLNKANEFKNDLEKFKIPITISKLKDFTIEEIFRIIKIVSDSTKENIIINVTSGNKVTSCLTLCAAYVYGLTAVAVMGENVMMFPIVRLSYYKAISPRKLKIMELLYTKKNCCSSLDQMAHELNMSLPLVSYHINGNQKVDGLKQMGLIDTVESRKRTEVTLNTLGEMLMMGYI